MTQILATAPLVTLFNQKIEAELKNLPSTPNLHVVIVGNNAASTLYVKRKQAEALKVGIECTLHHLPLDIPQGDLNEFIKTLSKDKTVTGLLLQLPLPEKLDATEVLNLIPAEKDVDGLTKENQQNLTTDNRHIAPATPLGIMRILKWVNTPLESAQVVVLGQSHLVGAPIANLLKQAGAQVQSFNSSSNANLKHSAMQQADIIISAAGCLNLVTPDLVKSTATVIDVGINRTENGQLTGDSTNLSGHVAALTPVPGGVGPMTVTSLLTNVIDAAAWQANLPVIKWNLSTLEHLA